MTPLVNSEPMMRPLHQITARLNYDHPGAVLVVYMTQRHSVNRITRAELRRVAKLDGKEPRFAASFEWLLLRINDTLPLNGWIIDEQNERYRLEPISQRHHERLVQKFNARR